MSSSRVRAMGEAERKYPPGYIDIHDDVNGVLGDAVESLRAKYPSMKSPDFTGQIVGIMIKTAIKLAKRDGCPVTSSARQC